MSIKIKIYNQKAEVAGEMELSEKVFGLEMNSALVHQAFVTQRANERQVLAHTKGRGEVSGGGKKPWRQKGTGRARAGSSRSPIWIGGGVTFGPSKDRNFKMNINQKMKRKALLIMLSDKLKHGGLVVSEKFGLDDFKTKEFNSLLKNLENIVKTEKDRAKSKRSTLVIISEKDDKVKFSGRNLPGVTIINIDNINITDLLAHKNLIIDKSGAEKINKKYQEKLK